METDLIQLGSAGVFVANDSGNADRLIKIFGANLRYCAGVGWLRWTGSRWEVIERPSVEVEACAKLVREEGIRVGGEVGKALEQHGRVSGNASKVRGCIELAEGRPEINVRPDELDADPWLLNCPNGTIDLRTSGLRPHRREDLCTKITTAPVGASAECPRFVQFVRECMGGDESLVLYLLRWLGYSLTADIREHALGLWYGASGRNGKGTLIATMLHLLGDYATTIASDVLFDHAHSQHTTGLMSLRGVRFAASNESPEGKRWNESLIKSLTGGDEIAARYMRQDFVTFAPTHKLVLACNARPVVREQGPAFWSRMHVLPWEVSFRGREDRELAARLLDEAPGILRLLVCACAEWQRVGLAPPPRVIAAGDVYRESQDTLGAFVDERMVAEPRAFMPREAVYAAFQDWARLGGEHFVPSARVFYRMLEERAWQATALRGVRGYRGWTWRPLVVEDARPPVSADEIMRDVVQVGAGSPAQG